LYHWSQVTQQIDTNTNLLLEAQQLGIDILKPRAAIVLPKQTLPIGLLDATDFQFDLDTTTLIVLTALPATIARFTTYCQTGQHRLGIGLFDRNVGNSVRQARQTLRISQIFQRPDFIHYSQIAFIQALLDGHLHVTDLQQRFQKLASTANGRELIKTLGMFVRLNTNVLQTAAALHIHRNTLSYRLDRLQQIFQLDPHQTLDLFTLYVGYLYFKADK
ncbi:MAG: sugar diacid utilization regulator, partial [Lactobacillus sp.]